MSQLRRRPYARRPRRPPLRLGPGAALCFFLAWPGPSRVSDGGLRALSSQRSVLQLNPTRLAPRCCLAREVWYFAARTAHRPHGSVSAVELLCPWSLEFWGTLHRFACGTTRNTSISSTRMHQQRNHP